MKTSAITLGRLMWRPSWRSTWVCAFWALALSPLRWALWFDIAIVVVLAQVAWHWRLIRGVRAKAVSRPSARNHWIGFTFFVGIAGSYALR